jgi:hypothetical protein
MVKDWIGSEFKPLTLLRKEDKLKKLTELMILA